MGRGRAKAKQTKVARELKYRPIETDFSSLERELRGDDVDEDQAIEDSVPDPYADLAAQYEDYGSEDDNDDYGRRSS